MLPVLFLVSGLVQFVAAKDVYLYWNVTWVTAAPDGFERPVIGINGQWPCPQIDVTVGDRLIVDVENGLGNQSTAIHWHGFHQRMSGTMDGASWVTQCPVAPGQVIRYDFKVGISHPNSSIIRDKLIINDLVGGSSWDILVSFAQYGSISRWASWSFNCS